MTDVATPFDKADVDCCGAAMSVRPIAEENALLDHTHGEAFGMGFDAAARRSASMIEALALDRVVDEGPRDALLDLADRVRAQRPVPEESARKRHGRAHGSELVS